MLSGKCFDSLGRIHHIAALSTTKIAVKEWNKAQRIYKHGVFSNSEKRVQDKFN